MRLHSGIKCRAYLRFMYVTVRARAHRSTLKINPLSEMCFFVSENIFTLSFSPPSLPLPSFFFLSLLTPSNVSFRHRKKIDSTFFAIFPMTMSRCASFDQADPLTVLLKLPARLSGGSFSRDTPRDRHSKCLEIPPGVQRKRNAAIGTYFSYGNRVLNIYLYTEPYTERFRRKRNSANRRCRET